MGISSKSKVREIIADERAAAIIEEYLPGFCSNEEVGAAGGMKLKTMLRFPQIGLPKETIDEIIARVDALDE